MKQPKTVTIEKQHETDVLKPTAYIKAGYIMEYQGRIDACQKLWSQQIETATANKLSDLINELKNQLAEYILLS